MTDVVNPTPVEKKKIRRQTPSEAAASALRRAEAELSAALDRFDPPSEETVAAFKTVEDAMDRLSAHLYAGARQERRALAKNGT